MKVKEIVDILNENEIDVEVEDIILKLSNVGIEAEEDTDVPADIVKKLGKLYKVEIKQAKPKKEPKVEVKPQQSKPQVKVEPKVETKPQQQKQESKSQQPKQEAKPQQPKQEAKPQQPK